MALNECHSEESRFHGKPVSHLKNKAWWELIGNKGGGERERESGWHFGNFVWERENSTKKESNVGGKRKGFSCRITGAQRKGIVVILYVTGMREEEGDDTTIRKWDGDCAVVFVVGNVIRLSPVVF